MDLKKWLTHYREIEKPARSKNFEADRVGYLDADFNKISGFSRLAAHHVVLDPHTRSSLPHAESLEEEFVLVLEGEPDLWIDGWIHPLKPLDAAGFPSGTGISHTLINNTDKPVRLLVLGERTKKENRCAFPLNPELKEEMGAFWWEPPTREFGPHDGRVHTVSKSEVASSRPEFVQSGLRERLSGFHYSGDNETFGSYTRLTDVLGLKFLGVGFEVLPPGKRSPFPHVHLVEEEFCFAVSGQGKVWLNGHAFAFHEGMGVAFPPGQSVAHVLINDSSEDFVYICAGESEVENDKLNYPLNEFRNSQCALKDRLWTEFTRDESWGSHSGFPERSAQTPITLRFARPQDRETILDLFTRSPGYFNDVEGQAPAMGSVDLAMTDGPKKTVEGYKKEFLMIERGGKALGVTDLHLHHPLAGVTYLGLLLLTEDLFGQGLGREIYRLIEDYLKRIHGMSEIRLGVSDDHDVSGYWRKMGFEPDGFTYEYTGENRTTSVVQYAKKI